MHLPAASLRVSSTMHILQRSMAYALQNSRRPEHMLSAGKAHGRLRGCIKPISLALWTTCCTRCGRAFSCRDQTGRQPRLQRRCSWHMTCARSVLRCAASTSNVLTCVTLNSICVVLWQLLLLSTRMRPIKQPMQNMQCIRLSGVLRLDKGRQCHHVPSVTSIRSWCHLIPASVAACHHL